MMQYGSFAYFLYPSVVLLAILVLILLFRERSNTARKALVLTLAFLNVAQHLLKAFLYPHLYGTGFSILNGAYNLCSLLILASPFVLLSKSEVLKDFICYFGTTAGIVALYNPYWFFGQSNLGWEGFRFYLCHGLLLATSILPLSLRLHKLSRHSWKKLGGIFFLALCIILADNLVFIQLGLAPILENETPYDTLYRLNPVWMMHPAENFTWIVELISPMTPNILIQNGSYVPILWYSIPLMLTITLGSFLFGRLANPPQRVRTRRAKT